MAEGGSRLLEAWARDPNESGLHGALGSHPHNARSPGSQARPDEGPHPTLTIVAATTSGYWVR